jgi:hypothetical protein
VLDDHFRGADPVGSDAWFATNRVPASLCAQSPASADSGAALHAEKLDVGAVAAGGLDPGRLKADAFIDADCPCVECCDAEHEQGWRHALRSPAASASYELGSDSVAGALRPQAESNLQRATVLGLELDKADQAEVWDTRAEVGVVSPAGSRSSAWSSGSPEKS